MDNIIQCISTLSVEILSEKLNVRNKAFTNLDLTMYNSKDIIVQILKTRKQNLDWESLYRNTIEAMQIHSIKLNDPNMREITRINQIAQYTLVLNKIITISAEAQNFLSMEYILPAKTVYSGINALYSNEGAKIFFGKAILQIFESYFLESPDNFRMLCAVNDLPNLFAIIVYYTNRTDKDVMLLALRILSRLLEIAESAFQCNSWLIQFLPQIQKLFEKTEKEQLLTILVLEINYFMLKNLMIDQHVNICKYFDENFVVFLQYYQQQSQKDIKRNLFRIFDLFIQVHFINSEKLFSFGDEQRIQSLFQIIITEVKERNFSEENQENNENFEKLCAEVIWQRQKIEENLNNNKDNSRKKIQKVSSIVEKIIYCIKNNCDKFKNSLWLLIFKNIISMHVSAFEFLDIVTILEFINTFILKKFDITKNIESIRIIVEEILQREINICTIDNLPKNLWINFYEIISSTVQIETKTDANSILRLLVKYKKINLEESMKIFKSAMKLNTKDVECLKLIKEIIISHGTTSLIKYINLAEIISSLFTNSHISIYKNSKTYEETTALMTEIFTLLIFNNYDYNNTINIKEPNQEISMYLEYKYLKRFVFIEQKKLYKSNINRKALPKNCINNRNFEELAIYFNFQSTEINAENVLRNYLIKILELIYFNQWLQVIDISNTTTKEILLKRMLLFLGQLETHFKQFDSNNYKVKHIIEYLQLIALICLKVVNDEELSGHINGYADSIVDFVVKCLKLIDDDEFEIDQKDIQQMNLSKIEIFSVFSATQFHNQKAFEFLKKIENGFTMETRNDIPKISKLLFRTFECLTVNGLSIELDIARWIIEHIQDVCRMYYTNLHVSNLVIDSLLQIFKSIQHLEAMQDDLFEIVFNFLKMCYKPLKCNSDFIKKILVLLKNIAIVYPGTIFLNADYIEIYLSVARLFKSSSVIVQFAVVEFTCFLIDPDNFFVNTKIPKEYVEFCKKLYEKLEWQKLFNQNIDNEDVQKNNASATIQLLLSFACLNQTKSEEAILDLAELIHGNDMNCIDFIEFRQISKHFQRPLSGIFGESIENLIILWLTKGYKMNKLPWWIFCENEFKFYEEFKEQLFFCSLQFDSKDYIAKIVRQTHLSEEQLFENTIEKCLAYSNAQNYLTPQRTRFAKMEKSIKEYLKRKCVDRSKQLFYIVQFVYDTELFHHYVEFPFSIENILCSHMNVDGFNKVLSRVLNINQKLLGEKPIVIIEMMKKLKIKIYSTVLINQKAIHLCRYMLFIELLLTNIIENYTNCKIDNYFLKDIINFLAKILKDCKGIYWICNSIFKFIRRASDHFLTTQPSQMFVIIFAFKDIIDITDNGMLKAEINVFFEEIFSKLNKIDSNLTESIELFSQNNIIQSSSSTSDLDGEMNNTEIEMDIENFLKNPNKGLHNIKKLTSNIFSKNCNFIMKFENNRKQMIENITNLFNVLTKQLLFAEAEEEMEIIKCLGTIGPIYINSYAFISNENMNFYTSNYNEIYIESNFVRECLNVVEKEMFNFDLETHELVLNVCKKMAELKIFKTYREESVLILDPFMNDDELSEDIVINCVTFRLKQILIECPTADFLKKITSNIYTNINLPVFSKMANEIESFSQSTFVPLCSFLLRKSEIFKTDLIELLEYFFEQANEVFSTATSSSSLISSKTVFTNANIIKIFLELTECLRIANKFRLPINLLNCANVASHHQANFLSVLYLELWASEQYETVKADKIRMNADFQKIALRAYKSIGCSHAVKSFLNPVSSRFEYLENSNNWLDMFVEFDTNASSSNTKHIFNKLKLNGLHNLAKVFNARNSDDVDYEILWRLGEWNGEGVTNDSENKLSRTYSEHLDHDFEKYHFRALKAIYEKDEVNVIRSIESARKLMTIYIKEHSIECIQNLYKFLRNLKLLKQIEDFSKLQFSAGDTIQTKILNNWENEKKLQYGNFHDMEKILAQKITLFEIAGIKATRKIESYYDGKDAIASNLMHIIEFCKMSKLNQPFTKKYIEKLLKRDCTPFLRANAILEDAQNCWYVKQEDVALGLLEKLMNNKEKDAVLPMVDAYRLYGQYCYESNKETFSNVYKNYLTKSVALLDGIHKSQLNGRFKITDVNFNEFQLISKQKNFRIIAELADKEYVQINRDINSTTFQTKVKIMNQNEKDAEKLNDLKDRESSLRRLLLSRNCNIDKNEINYFYKKQQEYLCIAMENYIEFSKLNSHINTPAIYRITSLWLSNKSNEQFNEFLEKIIFHIPTYKFICVLPQLMAHINSQNEKFLGILQKLLIDCAIDHPHHALNHFYCLVNSYEDIKDSKNDPSLTDLRCIRAKKCMEIIRNNEKCLEIIKQMDAVSLALIDLANYKTCNKANTKISKELRKLKNLNRTHYMTEFLPIKFDKNYQDITTISHWLEDFQLVGGINAPKKLTCVCSDGTRKSQLLKDQDDMRQDTIMQQFFTFVNHLLQDKLEFSARIRTYKVVPLSKRSGILEWCENVLPLGAYLNGNKGAHAKYRPNDWLPPVCRKKMELNKTAEPSNLLKLFLEICENIQPVFHNFFLENFHLPGIWFERRLSYMNSVAVSSIVGYVLGLGDRHLNNILLDKNTAEVIHIDFGIAFEQGKIMPTPELVPFRLTRDILAPMGVCEHNGVFQNSCEETLKILQEHKSVLLTILEVLIYDPLYLWAANPKVLKNNLNIGDEEKNSIADRALTRVLSKLEGRDDIKIGFCSVETQVKRLITEATSVDNLFRMFHGWDPYL